MARQLSPRVVMTFQNETVRPESVTYGLNVIVEMATQSISERAVERLEDKGYLKNVRAELRAEVMKCLCDMEKNDEIPHDLRIKRYSPPTEEAKRVLAYISEFLRFHGLKNTHTCFQREVKVDGRIDLIPLTKDRSALSERVSQILPE